MALLGADLLEDSADTPMIVPPSVQAKRDVDRAGILRQELATVTALPDSKEKNDNIAALNKELGSINVAPAPAPAPSGPSLLGPAINALDDGGKPAPAPMPKPLPTFKEALVKSAENATAPIRSALETGLSLASGTGQAILGGWRGLSTLAFGGSLDEAVRQVHNPELVGGTTARAYEPPAGSEAESANKILSLPGEAVGYVGRKAGQATMDISGSPAAATAVETGINAIPLIAIKGGKKTPTAPQRALPAPATAAITDATNYDVPTYMRRREPMTVDQPSPGAASTKAPEPQVTEQGVQPVESSVKFDEPAAPSAKPLPAEEQARRMKVLGAIGLNDARTSAITGDQTAANTVANAARMNSEEGQFLKGKLDNERAALTTYAEQIARDTGGSAGTDSASTYARGNTILAPLDDLKTYFKDETGKLYNEARERGANQPVTLDGFDAKMKQNSSFTANTDTLQLREGVKDFMKETNMMDKDGNILPSTVDQVENLRKYIGSQWSKNSNGVIRDMKQSLDNDVSLAAGYDTFAKARALHQMKAATLDDPKGIAKIMYSEGPDGINRAVDIEKVPDAITSMPSDQLAHIVKTLQNVPAQIQPKAQAALAEIKSHFANKVVDAGNGVGGTKAGQWDSRAVTKYLRNNEQRLRQVFSDDEMQKFSTLNDAGNILRIEGGYPGAAVQGSNIVRAGLAKGADLVASGAGALIGSFIGKPRIGAAAGEAALNVFRDRADAAARMKSAKGQFVRLGDIAK